MLHLAGGFRIQNPEIDEPAMERRCPAAKIFLEREKIVAMCVEDLVLRTPGLDAAAYVPITGLDGHAKEYSHGGLVFGSPPFGELQ